jgi:hypothetical protein
VLNQPLGRLSLLDRHPDSSESISDARRPYQTRNLSAALLRTRKLLEFTIGAIAAGGAIVTTNAGWKAVDAR